MQSISNKQLEDAIRFLQMFSEPNKSDNIRMINYRRLAGVLAKKLKNKKVITM